MSSGSPVAASHSPELAEAVKQVRATVGVARLDDYTVLHISGADSGRFLQNRLSNDVLALQPGQGHLNAALDRQGKIEGVFSLHRTQSDFVAIVYRPETESAVQGILKYRIVEHIDVRDAGGEQHILSIQGPLALEILLKAAAHSEQLKTLDEYDHAESVFFGMPARLIRRSFSGEEGYLLISDREHSQIIWNCLKQEADAAGGLEMPADVRDVMRIEAGWPLFGIDYDRETLLPETGLERLAVSYSKGCYLGQETIARVKTYGMVQKAMVGLQFQNPAVVQPPVDTPCLLEGKPAGVIKSGAYSPTLACPVALAYLGKNERIPGKMLNLEMVGRIEAVTVTLLPFYDARQASRSGQELLAEGLKLFSDGFDEEAIRILNQAIEADDSLLEAYEALGVILGRHERYDEAVALMEKILSRDPDHVLAHTNLSVFYMKMGDKEKAEEEKAKATMAAFSRKAKEAGLTVDLEAERRKKEEAALERIAMFQEALKFNPEDPLGNFGLGSAYLELRRYEEAIEPFKKVIQAQPKHTVAYLSLAKSYECSSKIDDARATYQKGIEVAAAKGDLMPLKEMQTRLEQLS